MNAIRPGAFEGVVQQFFEAAAVPDRWPAALQAFAEACGGEGAAAHSAHGRATLKTVVSEGAGQLYDDFVKRWRAPELNSHRARGLALLETGWRGAFTEQDIFTPEDLARDPFHQEFIVPNGFSSFAGMILAKDPGSMLSVSIYRKPAQDPYQPAEIATINRIVEHLRAASAAAVRLGLESTRRLADTLGQAMHPIALIRRDGRVAHSNARFNQLLGADLYLKAERIASWQAAADRALAAAIGRAVGHDGILREPLVAVVLPRRGGQRPLVAHVIPVVGVAHDLLQTVSCIVTLVDLESRTSVPPESILREAFGLSAAEAHLAAAIASGKTLAEISAAEGIARETARARLKSVFGKTETGRQAELVLLLSRLASPSGKS